MGHVRRHALRRAGIAQEDTGYRGNGRIPGDAQKGRRSRSGGHRETQRYACRRSIKTLSIRADSWLMKATGGAGCHKRRGGHMEVMKA